jgi:phage terminase Nu1 subunit (DNA packaging protein)
LKNREETRPGRVPVPLWGAKGIADYFGVAPYTVRIWDRRGAPIKRTEKGLFVDAWAMVDWLYDQPDYEPDKEAQT